MSGEFRRCFRDPVPEVLRASELLSQAADFHLSGQHSSAEELIHQADLPEVREWVESIWGAGSPYVIVKEIENAPPRLSKEDRVPVRMPNAAEKRELHERDGFHCRFCGVPVMRVEIRKLFQEAYPDAAYWGGKNIEQHPAFQALWLQYDHVLPHSRGGGNGNDNVVITCAPCNFGRMDNLCEEVGIQNPFDHQPVSSDWDGLERLLKS